MHRNAHELRDVLKFAHALIYFVFIGAATVAVAVAAHLYHPPVLQ